MLNGGQIPYKEMYKADPYTAAVAAVTFTLIFVLFSQYFVLAIIIQTYAML